MKTHATRPVETRVVLRVTCDLCGREREGPGKEWPKPDNPMRGHKVSVYHHEVVSGPDPDGGGSSRELDLDICPQCFSGKVLPALRALGLNREYQEIDY